MTRPLIHHHLVTSHPTAGASGLFLPEEAISYTVVAIAEDGTQVGPHVWAYTVSGAIAGSRRYVKRAHARKLRQARVRSRT